MPLPSSGAISLSQVSVELGASATSTRSLGDSTTRTLFGVASGAISMSQGYGKSNAFTFNATIAANTTNYNLKSAAIAAGWNQTIALNATITINSGVYVGSTSTGSYGFDTGSTFPSGTTLSLINNGFIVGMGGNGGGGSVYSGGCVGGSAGGSGGPALRAQAAISITNNGTIGGGGGGGGGGGAGAWNDGYYYQNLTGGSGGGGRGLNGGSPNGSFTSAGGGAGGAYFDPNHYGGAGGNGGNLGASGSPGATGIIGGGGGCGGKAGGSGGAAVAGNANITWSVLGTRLGAIT